MNQVTPNQKISKNALKEHYQKSRANYDIESGESHLAYYRDKYPLYFKLLIIATNKY